MQSAWSAIPYRTAIGLAKDGRIIWSPYSSGSNPYSYCDVDVCNGVNVNNFYGYATTFFAPILLDVLDLETIQFIHRNILLILEYAHLIRK